LDGENITIYKDPNSVIQYTYIADMIAAILLVLIKGECGQAYNSGGDEIVKIDDVISWMVHADDNIKSELIEKNIDANYSFAKGKGINFLKLSNEKLINLGWHQLFNNEEGFKRTVRCYFEKNRKFETSLHKGQRSRE
jgi:dTDP-D-glucose 4,6-dehydratase